MALWKSEHGSAYEFIVHSPRQHPDLAVLIAAAVAPGLVLVWLVPLPLVLPVLSVVSFAVAGVAALFAHYSGVDRRARGVTAWDVAGVFTLMWICAGLLSGPKRVLQLFGDVTMIP
jgi:hypothetical protein